MKIHGELFALGDSIAAQVIDNEWHLHEGDGKIIAYDYYNEELFLAKENEIAIFKGGVWEIKSIIGSIEYFSLYYINDTEYLVIAVGDTFAGVYIDSTWHTEGLDFMRERRFDRGGCGSDYYYFQGENKAAFVGSEKVYISDKIGSDFPDCYFFKGELYLHLDGKLFGFENNEWNQVFLPEIEEVYEVYPYKNWLIVEGERGLSIFMEDEWYYFETTEASVRAIGSLDDKLFVTQDSIVYSIENGSFQVEPISRYVHTFLEYNEVLYAAGDFFVGTTEGISWKEEDIDGKISSLNTHKNILYGYGDGVLALSQDSVWEITRIPELSHDGQLSLFGARTPRFCS